MTTGPIAVLQAARIHCLYRVQQGDHVMGPCPECGHLLALHVGEDDCPVCRLVHAPAMRSDAIREALRRSVSVLQPGETLVVLLPPYFTNEQIEAYQRRIMLMLELSDIPNRCIVLVGDGLVVAEKYHRLQEYIAAADDILADDGTGDIIGYREKEKADERVEESTPEGEPDDSGGTLPGGPPAEGGPEAPGPLPGSELPEVHDAEGDQGPAEDEGSSGTEGLASGPEPEDGEAPAGQADGRETPDGEADGTPVSVEDPGPIPVGGGTRPRSRGRGRHT